MKIDEDEYKADAMLMEKYQAYSAELLRISLLGIALLGFFIDKVSSSVTFSASSRTAMLWIMGISAAIFSLAAACSLAHRYYSTDGLFYHLRLVRRNAKNAAEGSRKLPTDDGTNGEQGAEKQLADLPPVNIDYLRRFLKCLGVGVPRSDSDADMRNATYSIAGFFLGSAATLASAASFCSVIAFFVAAIGYNAAGSTSDQKTLVSPAKIELKFEATTK